MRLFVKLQLLELLFIISARSGNFLASSEVASLANVYRVITMKNMYCLSVKCIVFFRIMHATNNTFVFFSTAEHSSIFSATKEQLSEEFETFSFNTMNVSTTKHSAFNSNLSWLKRFMNWSVIRIRIKFFSVSNATSSLGSLGPDLCPH